MAATKSSLLRGRRRLRAVLDRPAPQQEVSVSEEERIRVLAYAELFNSRRFDELRDLLTEHVRVEVVSAATLEGKEAATGRYFGNYARQDVSARPVQIDGRPALLLKEAGRSAYVVIVAFDARGIVGIRDFRHTGYEFAASTVNHLQASNAIADAEQVKL